MYSNSDLFICYYDKHSNLNILVCQSRYHMGEGWRVQVTNKTEICLHTSLWHSYFYTGRNNI